MGYDIVSFEGETWHVEHAEWDPETGELTVTLDKVKEGVTAWGN